MYKSENTDGDVLMMDIRLTATGTENLAEMLADEDTEKIQVQNYPASLETTDTSWNYTIDLGSFTEGLNLYVSVYFETGDEEYASIKELAAATNTMKNDPDTYYQKSLELLEAMLTAAEFREPVDSWFE